MDNLISQSEVLEMISRTKEAANADEAGFTKSQRKAIRAIADLFLSVVKDIPSVDAAPVVHARWDDGHRCTECICLCTTAKMPQGHLIFIETPYCPNCGARMDGE